MTKPNKNTTATTADTRDESNELSAQDLDQVRGGGFFSWAMGTSMPLGGDDDDLTIRDY